MPLGLEDDRVPDPKFRASSSASFYCAARNARLHQQRAGRNGGAWCSRVSNRKQWLQVDFGTDTVVTKVCTQGRQNSDQWVTSYYLSFSSRGQKFVTYKEGRQTKVDWETIALCVTVQTSLTLLLRCVRLSLNTFSFCRLLLARPVLGVSKFLGWWRLSRVRHLGRGGLISLSAAYAVWLLQ